MDCPVAVEARQYTILAGALNRIPQVGLDRSKQFGTLFVPILGRNPRRVGVTFHVAPQGVNIAIPLLATRPDPGSYLNVYYLEVTDDAGESGPPGYGAYLASPWYAAYESFSLPSGDKPLIKIVEWVQA